MKKTRDNWWKWSYKMDGFEKTKWKKVNTPWGKPSDEILIASLGEERFVLF